MFCVFDLEISNSNANAQIPPHMALYRLYTL